MNASNTLGASQLVPRRLTQRVPLAVRKLPYLWADRIQGTVDLRRIKAQHPGIEHALFDNTPQAALRAAYDDYTSTVSTAEMAVSWPTAVLLYNLCDFLRPSSVLDLGSGFSTFVFCTWAAKAASGTDIVSVDDSDVWMQRTREFLRERNLEVPRLIGLTDFERGEVANFDLAFHDLGRLEVRIEWLPAVLRAVNRTGLVVLDNVHVHTYRQQALHQLSTTGWRSLSLRTLTLDDKGRFAALAVRA